MRKMSAPSRLGMCRSICTAVLLLTSQWLGSNVQIRADIVQYEVAFDATWSSQTHPQAYPPGAHFSGLIGGTHNQNASFWQEGLLASEGIERMAEVGSKSPLSQEVEAAISAGEAYSVISGAGILSPASTSTQFEVSATHSLATVVSMIAPSPDWFVGTSGVNLRLDGRWLPQVVVDLMPYDAGTDSGPDFRSPNDDTNPAEPIHEITGTPFQSGTPLGTFTFRLVSLPGDLNSSGSYDGEDVDVLCTQIGSSSPRYDFTDDGLTDVQDVTFLVETLAGTRIGDANLDGRVAFDDFLALSGDFGGSANYSHGDFDCNGLVEFKDFLNLSQNFGFERSAEAGLATVPEPSSWMLVFGGCLLWRPGRRR